MSGQKRMRKNMEGMLATTNMKVTGVSISLVTVDDSRTEVLELNDTNDAGIGLKSVIRSPYELTVNELYKGRIQQ